jgi:hypothetical protein
VKHANCCVLLILLKSAEKALDKLVYKRNAGRTSLCDYSMDAVSLSICPMSPAIMFSISNQLF